MAALTIGTVFIAYGITMIVRYRPFSRVNESAPQRFMWLVMVFAGAGALIGELVPTSQVKIALLLVMVLGIVVSASLNALRGR